MIGHQILESKLINQYNKLYDIFAQNNVLKLNLSEVNIIQGLIQDVKADNVNSTYKKEIITPYGTGLKTGDYITHISNGKSINYLVESQIDKEIGCDKAYLLECPYNVNIFDYDYNNILSFPISLKNNNAKLGVTEGAIAITANSSFDIILKYDIHTRSFVKSDNLINGIVHARIMRVLIDGMAFSVVGVNHLISEGLLVISIENTNITPADNLELGVADYTTYYKEPIDYNGLIDVEILKYEQNATVTKNILANEIITDIVKKLRYGQTANEDITVSISAVGTNNLLTLNSGIVRLKNQISFEDDINTTTVTLSFFYGGITKTLTVNVTIEKQDNTVTPPNLVISCEYEDLPISETNDYSINTTDYVTWTISNVSGALTLNATAGSNKCSVTCENNTSYIGKQETLTAKVNVSGTEFEYTYIIYIVGLI